MAECLLQATALAFGWPQQPPLFEGVNLQLRRGEVLALLGPNGGGKSTLMQLLLGVLSPQQGRVMRYGEVSFVPQSFAPPFAYRVRDIVLMGRARHIGLFRSPSTADLRAADDALRRLDMLPYAEREFSRLSGGQRQLVLIARALAGAAPAMILDEPTSALDLHHQDRVLRLMRQLADERAMAVMFSTHQPNHAHVAADQALLLSGESGHRYGACEQVLTARHLSPLFQLPIERVSFQVNGARCETLVPLYRRGNGE